MYTCNINIFFTSANNIFLCIEYIQDEHRERHLNAASSVPSSHNNISPISQNTF